MQWYRGKKVYLVGGSQGIGRAAAIQLAAAGAHVWIGARKQQHLDGTLDAMREAGADGQILGAVAVDVTDSASVTEASRAVLQGLDGLDVVICNQGHALTGYLHEIPDEYFEQMIETNYLGHVRVTRSLLGHFMEQRSGRICLVSSMLGFMGLFGYGAYSASKHAIAGFARCLRQDLLPYDVGVSVFYPPTTDTPGLARENEIKPAETWALEKSSRQFPPEVVAEAMLRQVRKGRFEATAGIDSWGIWMLCRYAPWLVTMFTDSDLRTFLRKRATGDTSDGE